MFHRLSPLILIPAAVLSLCAAAGAARADALAGVPPECVKVGIARAEADYAGTIGAIADGAAKAKGIALGKAAAAAVISRRTNDGSTAALVDPKFQQGQAPGQWRFTPGSPQIAFAADWGLVKPFVLNTAAQFRPARPLAVSCTAALRDIGCREYAADLDEVRRLGADGVSAPSARSSEQTEIALFWMESSPTAWNRIARSVSAAQGLDLWGNARLFGLLNAALADGYVAS